MKRFTLLFALSLLSACGIYAPLNPASGPISGVVPVNEVAQTKSFTVSSAIDSMFVTAQGSRIDAPESADPKIEAALVAALKKHGIDIRRIVSKELQASLSARPALQPKPGSAANTRMALSIDAFGTSTFFSSYGPNLGLQAQLLDNRGLPVWKNYKFVTHRNREMPHFNLDELINNPAALRTAFEAAAKITIKQLLDDLENELKTPPATAGINAPSTSTPEVAPNPDAIPTAVPGQQAPEQTPKPAPTAIPKEENCNGWCVPGGKIKLFD